MRKLIQTGYDAAYITEHDAVWTEQETGELQRAFPRIRVFPGVELSMMGDTGEHVIVLGTADPDYLLLDTPEKVIAKAREDGHLTLLAHPFRWKGSADMLWHGVLPDALEHRTNNHDFDQAAESEVEARRLKLPLVNAGDTHTLSMVNRYWIETARPIEKADDIREIILKGEYVNRARDE
jgi:hypothetical protein